MIIGTKLKLPKSLAPKSTNKIISKRTSTTIIHICNIVVILNLFLIISEFLLAIFFCPIINTIIPATNGALAGKIVANFFYYELIIK